MYDMASIPIGKSGYKYIPDPPGKKFCKRCKHLLDVVLFGPNKTRPDGLSYWCKPCTNEHNLLRYRTQQKARSWLKHYGLTPNAYQALLDKQGGVCAICRNPETHKIKGTLSHLAVDHDHTTGAVRGLLCNKCNHGVGNFCDSTELLEQAIEYLHTAREST